MIDFSVFYSSSCSPAAGSEQIPAAAHNTHQMFLFPAGHSFRRQGLEQPNGG